MNHEPEVDPIFQQKFRYIVILPIKKTIIKSFKNIKLDLSLQGILVAQIYMNPYCSFPHIKLKKHHWLLNE